MMKSAVLLLSIGTALFISTATSAQQTRRIWGAELMPDVKNLRIGEVVPASPIPKIINDRIRSAKTSDFKNRLLILDFWDTSCSACIESMPKLDSMQRKFDEKRVKILSVTWQKELEIRDFFKNNKFLKEKNVNRPTVVDDRILNSYFRHQLSPHIVWINKGKVIAITDQAYLNEKNIQTILSGTEINWPLKNDSFDKKLNIMQLNNPEQYASNSKFNYSVLTGQTNAVHEIGGINYVLDTLQQTSRIALFNQSIISTYRIISFSSDPIPRKFILTPGRLVLEVKDSLKYIYQSAKQTQADWNKENLICYEMVVGGNVKPWIMAQMALKDLDNKLGIHGRWEKRVVKCLVLVKNKEVNIDSLNAKREGQTIAMSAVPFYLFDLTNKYPPTLDETGINGNLNLIIEDFKNIEDLKKQLQLYGLNLIEADRKIEVMVITDTKD